MAHHGIGDTPLDATSQHVRRMLEEREAVLRGTFRQVGGETLAIEQEMARVRGAVGQLGPTGTFPEGQLTERDAGGLAMSVGAHRGKVILDFGTTLHWIGFNPAQARELAASLIEKADAIENYGGGA